MTHRLEIRRNSYHDSVTLMRASRRLVDHPGVRAALIAMGTPVNVELLADMGFDRPEVAPTDLFVAVHADSAEAADSAVAAGLAELVARPSDRSGEAMGGSRPTRTVRAAAAAGSDIVLVSVPGEHAFVEAMDALESGVSVMVFSDNVPVDDEVRLKDEATRRGLLCLGPDAGTTIVGGVGLGFANAVSPGPVGIVAASGTGAQQLSCLLDAAGVGVSHVLGVGGRDLGEQVAGRGTIQALTMLDADPATELIVVVSKPPAGPVAARLQAAALGVETPVVLGLLGTGEEDLSTVAAKVLGQLGRPVPAWPEVLPAERQHAAGPLIRGMFAGGTLCKEAMIVSAPSLGRVLSNIPLRPEWHLRGGAGGGTTWPGDHVMVDFGEDEFTDGRPHPMIDGSVRLRRLLSAVADPATGVVLLDVVLGFGAHPDPAGEIVSALAEAADGAPRRKERVPVVVSLCGTEGDPQRWSAQAATLAEAGASVHLSNAAAARHATALVARTRP